MSNMVGGLALVGSFVCVVVISIVLYKDIKDLHSIFKKLGALDDKEAIKRGEK